MTISVFNGMHPSHITDALSGGYPKAQRPFAGDQGEPNTRKLVLGPFSFVNLISTDS